ncbi:MAG: carboxypeptidase-like regulatory domain-containing protein [Candidatus Methanomethylicus sp.]|nr:carboxypeptidase-like regulatory domain-containing protein [Candidatus Methanomethylicus sp.]
MKSKIILTELMLTLLLLAPVSFVASQPPYPVSDAYVDLSGVSPDGSTYTGALGTFTITGLGIGNFTGTVGATGYLEKSISGTISQGTTFNLGDIYLLPSATVKGTVLDHTGSPAGDAMVFLLNQNNNTAGYAFTESDGSFTINTNIETGTYSIYASPPGFFFYYTGSDAASDITYGINATEGQTTSGITLHLIQSGTITGRVTNNVGSGVEGISIFASTDIDDRYGNLAVTDANGYYTMSANLPAGPYNVSIPFFSSIEGYYFNTSDVRAVTLSAGGSATVNFQLQVSGSISGTITQYDGSPAPNVTVYATGPAGTGFADTNADGSYTINSGLGTGEYTVYAAYDFFNSESVNVTAGALTSPVDFQLDYNLAWISGKISNATGPLSSADAEGEYEVPNPFFPAMNTTDSNSDSTDSNGNYLLEIHVPGNWTSVQVNVTASDSGYQDASQVVTVTKGQTTSNVNFVLQATPRGSVQGRVVSNTPPPKLNADLTLTTSAATISIGSSVTLSGTITPTQSGTVTIYESINGSGYFTHSTRTLSAGAYSISFIPSDVGMHQYYATWPGNTEYNQAQSPTVSINVTAIPLQTSSLTISGSVTISVNNSYVILGMLSPIRTGNVTLYQSYNGSAFASVASRSLVAGQYSYILSPSGPGTYQFYAVWPGDNVTTPANSTTTTITVTPIQLTTPTVTIQSSLASVYPGQAVTLSGTITPSATGTVTIWQSVNSSAYQQIANATLTSGAYTSQYTIAGPGTYQFKASFAGNEQLNPAQSSSVTVNSQRATPTLTIQASSATVTPGQAVTLSGTITPSATGTVALWVAINGSATFQNIANATLTSGAYTSQYTIAGPGTYQFKASFAGNEQVTAAQSTVASVISAQAAAGTDYTWYIIGGVAVVAIIALAYFFMRKPK